MGIFTKTDTVRGLKTKRKWIGTTLQIDELKLKLWLGWHVVRKRDPTEAECSFGERDRIEKEYFKDSFWTNEVPDNQLGINSLRSKLSGILEKHTRKALPDIMRKLDSNSKETEQELKNLGESRSNSSD